MANSLTHAGMTFPIKGCLYTIAIPYLDADGDPVDPTSPDTEVSLNGGASFTDCTNEVTTGGGNGAGFLTLTAAEMNSDLVVVAAKSSNAKTTLLTIQPYYLAVSLGETSTMAGGTFTANRFDLPASVVDVMMGGPETRIEGLWVVVTSGSGVGQARMVSGYSTASVVGIVLVEPAFETVLASDSFVKFGFPLGVGTIRAQLASSGGFAR